MSRSYLLSRTVDELEQFAAAEEVREHDLRVITLAAAIPACRWTGSKT
jgi:hypothetical protein